MIARERAPSSFLPKATRLMVALVVFLTIVERRVMAWLGVIAGEVVEPDGAFFMNLPSGNEEMGFIRREDSLGNS